MKKHKVDINIKNIAIYILGAIIIAFAVIMMKRSNLGMSSWDTLHNSINKLTGMTLGTAIILVASIITIFITIANRELKYIFMFVPVVFVGYVVDFFDLYLLVNFIPVTIITRILTLIAGLLLLPLGGTLLIISSFPAGVFDELMITLMRIFKTNKMAMVRVIMEISAVLVALILGFMAGIGFGMINIGTLIFSVTVGGFIKLYLKLFERIGMYEIEQID